MRDTEFTGIWRGTLGDRRGPREQTEDGKVGKCRDERWRPEGGGEVQEEETKNQKTPRDDATTSRARQMHKRKLEK